jgi:hypothetical protein
VSAFELDQQVEDLRRALENTQRQLAKQKARTDELVAATQTAAREAVLATGGVKLPARRTRSKKRGAEVALWHLTDWQGAKVTPSYNSQVMRDRVLRFCDKAARLAEIQRADHPVDDLVILFGGDMIEGLFNFPTQPYEIDATLFGQYVTVSKLMTEVVQFALSEFSSLKVIAEWGNHGRLGSKRDAVPRSDNADRMTYELARSLVNTDPRVTWEDCPEDIQRVEIGNYRALSIHGDELGRNGHVSAGGLMQAATRWASGAYDWDFRDVFVGHYHVHCEYALPNGRGAIYQTGSTESENRYASVSLAASAIPSQRVHFVDPVAGRTTAQFKVWVDA